MLHLFKDIKHKLNGIIWSFISTGIILLMLAVLMVWTDFMLKLVVGLVVVIISYTFIYSGYKIWLLKRDIEKHCAFFLEKKK